MARQGPLIAFLGPSLPRSEVPRGVEVLPPARRGDVLSALERRPAALALIDGVFEASPSVWHREILAALESGVAVFGGSSMGALRAAELDGEGMIGVGTIYGWFRDGLIADDAEVALLHADAEHGFRPLTVPLVNVRHLAARARASRALRPEEADALIAAAERCFYADRSWPRLLESVRWSQAARERWSAFAANGLQDDLKAEDARACLATALAYVRSGARLPARPPSAESSWSRRLALEGVEGAAADAQTEAVLARKTLAGIGRAFGLDQVQPPPAAEGPPWARARAAETHLAQRVLEGALRLLPDGPSRSEAAATARLESTRRLKGRR